MLNEDLQFHLCHLENQIYEWYEFTNKDYSQLDNLSEKEVCESAGDGFIFAYSMKDSPRGCCDGGCCKPSSISF